MSYTIEVDYTVVDAYVRITAPGESPQKIQLTQEELPVSEKIWEQITKPGGVHSSRHSRDLQILVREYILDALYYKSVLKGRVSNEPLTSIEIHRIRITFHDVETHPSYRLEGSALMTPGEILAFYELLARKRRIRERL